MTLSEMIEMLHDYMDDPRARTWPPDKSTRYLNRGLEHVLSILFREDSDVLVKNVDFTLTTTSGDIEEDLPADFVRVHKVERLRTGQRPIPLSYIDFKNRDNATSSYYNSGDATIGRDLWYLRDNKIGITEPSEIYTWRVHYVYAPTALSAQTDIPPIPTILHNAIVLYAVRLAKPSIMMTDGFREVYFEELQKVTQMATERQGEPAYTLTDPEDEF